MKTTREFYIPKDATKRDYPEVNAEVYISDYNGKPWAICFSGKRQKPDQKYYYRDNDRMEKDIQKWLDGLRRRQEYKAQAKAERTGLMEPAHSAKTLKGYLQQFFPGVKFSVSSKTYSMGCSIDVDYTDGPLSEEVEAIAGLFRNSGFDGMTDCSYSIPVHVPGCSGASHVSVNREMSPELQAAILPILQGRFAHRYGDGDKVNDYAPYQLAEAEKLLLGVTVEDITQRNRERVAIVTGIAQDAPGTPESTSDAQTPCHVDPPQNVVTVDFTRATKRQLWALHCITRLDTREWPLTKEQASTLIDAANSGKDITEEIRIILP